MQDTRWGSLTPLQRSSWCILQPQLTGPQDTRWGSLTSLQRSSRCILQPQLTGPQDTRWGSITPLQRSSQCILQPQLTGPQDTRWGSLNPLQRSSVYSTAPADWAKDFWAHHVISISNLRDPLPYSPHTKELPFYWLVIYIYMTWHWIIHKDWYAIDHNQTKQ